MPQAAPVIAAVAAVGSLAYSIQQGGEASKRASRARAQQEKAQATSAGAAASQARANAMARRQAEARKPNVASLLAQNTSGGGSPTMLSGGVDPTMLDLARTTLLGG